MDIKKTSTNNANSDYLSALIDDYGYMLSIDDVCTILDISRPTVEKLINTGDLPAAKVGNRARIATKDFVMWWDMRVLSQQNEMMKGCLRK